MSKITIGKYLIDKIQKEGISDVFGIPGDYVIGFFGRLEESPLNVVTTCSEPGSAFAADAYARLNGIGALCITYSVGGLNTINAVAGAYAEKSPVVVISGSPGLSERDRGFLLHHSVINADSQFNAYKNVTAASTQLHDPNTAIYEIDRVFNACKSCKRPVYIEIPRDMVDVECEIPPKQFEFHKKNDLGALEEALSEAVSQIQAAQKPVIVGGVEIARYGLKEKFLELLDVTKYPYATTFLGKSIIDENHPQFMGIYVGKVGQDNIRQCIEDSDCIIMLGTLMTDTNLATAQLDQSKIIYATADDLCIKYHHYKDVDLEDFITGLTLRLKDHHKQTLFNVPEKYDYIPQNEQPLTINRFFERLKAFIEKDNAVICDIGDGLFGSVNIKLPENTPYLGPVYYTSMGYSVPAGIGVKMYNPNFRPIIIVGDGAFQMTGQEVSCYVKYGLNPIVFVINNQGYTTQRYLKDGRFNDLQDWAYEKITELVQGGLGLNVKTEDELEIALKKAKENTESFTILNLHFDRYDKSDTLFKLTEFLGKRIK